MRKLFNEYARGSGFIDWYCKEHGFVDIYKAVSKGMSFEEYSDQCLM